MSDSTAPREPPRGRDQPLPAAARPQPRGLVPLGAGGAGPRQANSTGRSSSPSATRRATGATSWSTRASRTRPSRPQMNDGLRLHQGGPRGAAGPRHDLHDRPPPAQPRRGRRLAADRVPHARPDAVLRRHLLPAGRPLRPHRPSFRRLLAGDRARRGRTAATSSREIGAQRRRPPRRRDRRRHAADVGADGGHSSTGASSALRRSFDPVARRLRLRSRSSRTPLELRLLLRVHARDRSTPGAATWSRSRSTKMARGGMYDQVGGGFARYSVDAEWLVPHFEKMLYDNALLASAYVEAFQATGDPFYEQIARETLDYVVREMTSHARRRSTQHAGRRQRGRGGEVLRLVARRGRKRRRPGTGGVRRRGLRASPTRATSRGTTSSSAAGRTPTRRRGTG